MNNKIKMRNIQSSKKFRIKKNNQIIHYYIDYRKDTHSNFEKNLIVEALLIGHLYIISPL